MKLVIQRVTKASVAVDGREIASINKGLLVLVGIKDDDARQDAETLANKLAKLRVMSFDSAQDKADRKMNYSIRDVGEEILAVSQFTLYADTKGNNRPSFIKAARPEVAEPLYNYFTNQLKTHGVKVSTGKFGAMMQISAVLDGPVTIIIES